MVVATRSAFHAGGASKSGRGVVTAARFAAGMSAFGSFFGSSVIVETHLSVTACPLHGCGLVASIHDVVCRSF